MARLAKMVLTGHGDPSDNRKQFVGNGCLTNTKKLLSRTSCRSVVIFWMNKLVLSRFSLTASMARCFEYK